MKQKLNSPIIAPCKYVQYDQRSALISEVTDLFILCHSILENAD